MNRLVMISKESCSECNSQRPVAQSVAAANQLRFIEHDIEQDPSYNYDILGVPYYILEDPANQIIAQGCGRLGLSQIEKKLKQ